MKPCQADLSLISSRPARGTALLHYVEWASFISRGKQSKPRYAVLSLRFCLGGNWICER